MIGADTHQQLVAKPARLLATLTFVVALAGQMTFSRFGLPNYLVIPERLFALVALLVVFVPLYTLIGVQRLTSVVRTGLPIAVLILVIAISAAWARPSLGLHKAEVDLFCLVAILLLTAIGLALHASAYTLTFMWCTAVTGFLYAVAGFAGGLVSDRISILGGGPNIFGRVCALGFVASLYLITRPRRSGWRWVMLPLPLLGTIASGSRGAVLSLAVSLVLYGWNLVGSDLAARLRRWIMLSIVCASGLFLFWEKVAVVAQERFITLTLEDRYDAGRTPLLTQAWRLFGEHPMIGAGLHGFEANYGYLVGFTYPHSFTLQVAAETGLLGLVAFAWVLVRSARWIMPSRRLSKEVAVTAACAVLVLTASQFSGDYYDSRFTWMYLLMALNQARDERAQVRDAEISDEPAKRIVTGGQLPLSSRTSTQLTRL